MVRRLIVPALVLGLAAPALAQDPPSEEDLLEQVRNLQESLATPAAPPEQEPMVDEAVAAEIRQRLGEELGVEVLDVRAIEANDRQAYAAKIMNPGGDSNAAFQVTTLVVDRESGEVLGVLAPSIGTAAEFSRGGASFQSDQSIRRRTYR